MTHRSWVRSVSRLTLVACACTQNFEKFLVDKEGNVVGRYSSMAAPESIANDIEKLL